MVKFLGAKLFLVEQQAMRHLYCEDIDEMKKAMKTIQEICASSVNRIEAHLDKEIDLLKSELDNAEN